MKKNNNGNVLVFVVIITAVIAGMVGSTSLYTYSIFYRVLDLKSQIYLALEGDSIKNKQFIDYLTDPITNSDGEFSTENNLTLQNFSKMVDNVDDRVVPGKDSYFFMTDFDLESVKELNKLKQLYIYYRNTTDATTGDFIINFVRYNRLYPSNFQTGRITLDLATCDANTNTDFSEYSCEYLLRDFSNYFKNNEYNYLLFFNSDVGVNYTIQGRDSDNNIVKLPSRYLDQEFTISSNSSQVEKTIKSKVDLYERFTLNLNKSLYGIR